MISKINNRFHDLLRKKKNADNRNKLLNDSGVTILSNNCVAGVLYHDLGLRFDSPTINLFIKSADYIKLLEDTERYFEHEDLVEVYEPSVDYPVGMLGDIKIYFMHYNNFELAKRKWEERCLRVNYSNMFVILSERDGCTEEHIQRFAALDFENKVAFVARPMEDIACSYFDGRFLEKTGQVRALSKFVSVLSGTRYIDYFDYVSFLNREKKTHS